MRSTIITTLLSLSALVFFSPCVRGGEPSPPTQRGSALFAFFDGPGEYGSLEDYPKENAQQSLDFSLISGQNVANDRLSSTAKRSSESWNAHWLPYAPENDDASDFFDIYSFMKDRATPQSKSDNDPSDFFDDSKGAAQLEPKPFDAVYFVREYYSPELGEGTLKLAVDGDTRAIFRVHFGCRLIYRGELGPSTQREAAIPFKIRSKKNYLVARVDYIGAPGPVTIGIEGLQGFEPVKTFDYIEGKPVGLNDIQLPPKSFSDGLDSGVKKE